jgi:hypothetical protein
MRGSSVVDEM